jgi:hypothetical protein
MTERKKKVPASKEERVKVHEENKALLSKVYFPSKYPEDDKSDYTAREGKPPRMVVLAPGIPEPDKPDQIPLTDVCGVCGKHIKFCKCPHIAPTLQQMILAEMANKTENMIHQMSNLYIRDMTNTKNEAARLVEQAARGYESSSSLIRDAIKEVVSQTKECKLIAADTEDNLTYIRAKLDAIHLNEMEKTWEFSIDFLGLTFSMSRKA